MSTTPPMFAPVAAVPVALPQRLASIDAFWGFVMFLMMAEVLRLRSVASAFRDDHSFWGEFWRFLAFHQTHVPWVGCSLHDMIQPGFTFIVGVAVPFSIASRIAKGHSYRSMLIHAFGRALILIFLGVFLRSMSSPQTNWTFIDTLTQIGLAYIFLFPLGFASFRIQFGALLLVLVGCWGAFALYPLPGEGFDWSQTGVAVDWEHNAVGFAAHWNKNTNIAWAFDTWFLNLFPREKPFVFQDGGYATLNFISMFGTMLLGLLAGKILRSERKWKGKCGLFLLWGTVCLGVGAALGALEICPVVKRIWTPSWTLYSGGICFLLLMAFYLLADVVNMRRLFFPLIVIGANSIGAYYMAQVCRSFFSRSLKIHLGADLFKMFGPTYEPLLLGASVLLIYWLILFWMYRQKIFIRI